VFDAVLYTWVYQRTNRSILAVILLHFTVNAFGELFELTFRSEVINFGLLILAAAAAAAWGLEQGHSGLPVEEK
jgi:membrane protease YdiL (CAAX protease family)